MYTALLITPGDICEIQITDGPHEHLGEVSIVGAFPDEDLVLLASRKPTSTECIDNVFINMFNKDDRIIGNLVVVKTDSNGNPINLSKKDISHFL